ncbi:MAG: hypothetical protein JWO44_1015 [Bacteroidetes bacterium]|nr:hypothetical protein [Bacteroidota bacterium]
MKKITRQNVRHLENRSKKELRNFVKRKHKIYKGQGSTLQPGFPFRPIIPPPIFTDKRAPAKFNLQYENCNGVINYINEIKDLGKKGRNINIILEDVTEIGEGAIAMLLSVTEELQKNGILIKGKKPKDGPERDILEKSGFFKHMQGHIEIRNQNSKNTILKTGGKTSDNVNLSAEMRKANETVWGEKGRNPPMRGAIYEMMRNSCDHAFRHENNIIWHFAISHDEENKQVKFSFVDNGRGIIKSFTEGFLNKVINLFTDNTDLLETAFRDGIESRTGLSWRGKGLPTIFENYEDGYFKNLVVISNDVFIDFDRKIHKKLDIPFSGTYYFWMLNQGCIKACYN